MLRNNNISPNFFICLLLSFSIEFVMSHPRASLALQQVTPILAMYEADLIKLQFYLAINAVRKYTRFVGVESILPLYNAALCAG